MWFTRLAISRPIIIWMALAAIAVLGYQSYTRLPAELYPRVSIPAITVTTLYPGGNPPEIETQISKPMEDAVGTVGGVRNVYSSSQANVSILSMDFQIGTNLDTAVAEARGRVETIRGRLPVGASPPVVSKLDINALPILYLGMESPSLTLQKLRALADNTIRPRLEQVLGVATVQVVGGDEREVHVSVDSLSLAQNNLTIEDVVNSLKAAGHDIPSGQISHDRSNTDVRLINAYSSLKALRDVSILSSPSHASSFILHPSSLPQPPLTISDVAEVTDTKAARTEINRINGYEGVSLVITKASDANTVTVVDGINSAFTVLKPNLPQDFKRVTLSDNAEIVREALADVNVSLILGAVLAMLVILLFLHNLRGTIMVSLAIPSCIAATFMMMRLTDFTLNQMTLLALSLSVGILVDDSIVILESITRHIQEGASPHEAALQGRREIGFADITTTLVDVVVFVPIAFMGGVVGSFFKQFGLTIAFATLFSLAISFSVTPMLASRWYKTGENLVAKHGVFAPLERFYRGLEAQYRRLIGWALGHRGFVIVFGIGSLAIIFLLSFGRLGTEFLPGSDQGQIVVNVEMAPGSSLSTTNESARRIEQIAMRTPDVEAVITNVGQILGSFGEIPQQGAQFAQINIRLKEKQSLLEWVSGIGCRVSGVGCRDFIRPSWGSRGRSDEEIAKTLRREISATREDTPPAPNNGGADPTPTALHPTPYTLHPILFPRITVLAVRSAIGTSLPIAIEMRGKDIDELTRRAEMLRDRIRAIPGLLEPDVTSRSGKPSIRVEIDPNKAAQFGIAPSLAGAILRDSLSGNSDSVLRDAGQEFPIRVQLKKSVTPPLLGGGGNQYGPSGRDKADVDNILLGSDASGRSITVGDIATTLQQSGPTNIDRSNGQRLVTVKANLEPDTPLGNARPLIQKEIDSLPHEGISIHWSGEAETLDDNAPMFANALILAIILVYLVMASLFNNLGTPFVIMFTLPMALIGAIGAMVVTGQTLSLVSCIGILMLVGLMGRNAILLLDYVNTLRERGMERNAALIEAGATRLRPILMTTTATIAGMLPVALRIGRASEVRAPMAIAVIGGLLVSTVLTLVVIPVLFSLYDDRFGSRKRMKDEG